MAPLAILLAATLRFTLPAALADTSLGGAGCGAGPQLLADLDSAFVYGIRAGEHAERLYWSARVRGLEGQPQAATVDETAVVTVWAVTTRVGGARSCPSNYVTLNLPPTDAPPAVAGPDSTLWFDVAGRRVLKPSAPGVYFWRRGRKVGSTVVTR